MIFCNVFILQKTAAFSLAPGIFITRTRSYFVTHTKDVKITKSPITNKKTTEIFVVQFQ